MRQKPTKIDQVIHFLLANKQISSWQAINMFRVTRLSDIIFKLGKRGWDISTEMIRTDEGINYAKYHLHLKKIK